MFGTAFKRESCYENIQVAIGASDNNVIKASEKYFAVGWRGGGGQLYVSSYDKYGRLDLGSKPPMLTGHTGEIIDFDFSPFNSDVVVTGSEDTTLKIYNLPDGGLKEDLQASATLSAHQKKILHTVFHPSADSILASTSADLSIKIWDLSKQTVATSFDAHPDFIQCLDWNFDGSLFATTCKDKNIRIVDVRGSLADTFAGHQGTKPSRILFLGNNPRLVTVGFSKTAYRQMMLWDQRNTSSPLYSTDIDNSAGSLMPFYDSDTGILFLAGKVCAPLRSLMQ